MIRLLSILFVVSAAACGGSTVYQGVNCSSDSDCTLSGASGTCQSTGFCAYPDATCAGGSRYAPGAGDMSEVCVGGPAACGAQNQACCSGSVCGADLVCTSGTCTCGDKDGPCCGGTTCGANLTCEAATTTCACGGLDQGCCGGTTCDTDLTCSNGSCTGSAMQVAVGKGHTCVLLTNGTVWCWGNDSFTFSQSTPGHRTPNINFEVPTQVPNLTGVVELRGGEGHTCARKSDNTLWCWGHNEAGELGNGTTIGGFAPVQVSGLSNVTMFDVGRQHTCAAGTVGGTTSLYCWGRGGRGTHKGAGLPPSSRLGNGTEPDALVPTAVNLTSVITASQTITSLSTGGYSTCIVTSDNKVWCWGNNQQGELGNNNQTASNVPVAVDLSQIAIPGGVTIDQVSLGGRRNEQSTCMHLSNDTVYCWGYNGYSQLGFGGTTPQRRPTTAVITTPLGGATLKTLVAGHDARCALDSAGAVWCWGRNQAGELGLNDPANGAHATLAQVPGLTGVTALVMDHRTACAIDAAHQLYCWGNNKSGQITMTVPATSAAASVLQPVHVAL